MLNKKRILELFNELDLELKKKSIHGDLFIVGGAAMSVAYDSHPSTKDIDGIWKPSKEVRVAAKAVANRNTDIGEDWLNDGVKGFLPGKNDDSQKVVYSGENFTVAAASPKYLLATKILASRASQDVDDIKFLIALCKFGTVGECLDIVEAYYPGRPIEAKSRFLLEELLEDA